MLLLKVLDKRLNYQRVCWTLAASSFERCIVDLYAWVESSPSNINICKLHAAQRQYTEPYSNLFMNETRESAILKRRGRLVHFNVFRLVHAAH